MGVDRGIGPGGPLRGSTRFWFVAPDGRKKCAFAYEEPTARAKVVLALNAQPDAAPVRAEDLRRCENPWRDAALRNARSKPQRRE